MGRCSSPSMARVEGQLVPAATWLCPVEGAQPRTMANQWVRLCPRETQLTKRGASQSVPCDTREPAWAGRQELGARLSIATDLLCALEAVVQSLSLHLASDTPSNLSFPF